jgi:hypothetical protein
MVNRNLPFLTNDFRFLLIRLPIFFPARFLLKNHLSLNLFTKFFPVFSSPKPRHRPERQMQDHSGSMGMGRRWLVHPAGGRRFTGKDAFFTKALLRVAPPA